MANSHLIKKVRDWNKKRNNLHQSTHAAEILFEIICTYKPSFYDAFGYDFSGKRKRLIETFIEDPHNISVDKYYGDELLAMQSCKRKGRLLQELKFGLLVNKILDDLNFTLRSKLVRENIHWSVYKIARASLKEYKEYKKTHPLHKTSKAYKNKQLQLA